APGHAAPGVVPRKVRSFTRSQSRELHPPETPGKQRGCILPDARLAVAKEDNDDVASPGDCAAGNETVPSRFGIAGFHSIAVGKPFKNLVRVFKLAGPSVGMTEH